MSDDTVKIQESFVLAALSGVVAKTGRNPSDVDLESVFEIADRMMVARANYLKSKDNFPTYSVGDILYIQPSYPGGRDYNAQVTSVTPIADAPAYDADGVRKTQNYNLDVRHMVTECTESIQLPKFEYRIKGKVETA